jgi:hypothetical protein
VSTPALVQGLLVGRATGHALDLPNISVIQDICEIEGRAFVAMDLLLGQTFRHGVEGRPFSWVGRSPWQSRFPICLGSQSRRGLC